MSHEHDDSGCTECECAHSPLFNNLWPCTCPQHERVPVEGQVPLTLGLHDGTEIMGEMTKHVSGTSITFCVEIKPKYAELASLGEFSLFWYPSPSPKILEENRKAILDEIYNEENHIIRGTD